MDNMVAAQNQLVVYKTLVDLQQRKQTEVPSFPSDDSWSGMNTDRECTALHQDMKH